MIDNTQPTPRTDVVSAALEKIYSQFHKSPVMNETIKSYLVECQLLENVFLQLWVLRTLDNAEGGQVDVLGRIVGELRLGRTDEEYKVAIASKVLADNTNATINDILSFLKAGDDRQYIITEGMQASFVVEAVGEMSEILAANLNVLLQKYKGGGVDAELLYHENLESVTFETSSSDSIETSEAKGFADTAETTGGYLADFAGNQ